MSEIERWREPPREIADVLTAPPTPWIFASPLARHLALVGHDSLPPLADLARPIVKLAGLRIDPVLDARWQTVFGTSLMIGVVRCQSPSSPIRSAAVAPTAADRIGDEGLWHRIELPSERRILTLRWSHGGERLALVLARRDGCELWVVDVAMARARLVVDRVHAVFGDGFEWSPDGESLFVALVPRGRGLPPARPNPLPGPIVVETRGERSPLRTFQDLLRSPHDEALLEHHAQSDLALVRVRDGSTRLLNGGGIVTSFDPSPDGRWLLVERVERPYSYVHTVHHFPRTIEALEIESGSRRLIARVPLHANVPIEGVRAGPRAVQWCAHGGARLAWVEALDGGDPRRAVPHRDRWLELEAPFDGAPRELARVEHRASGISWMPDAQGYLVRHYDRDRRWTKLELRFRDGRAPRVLDDRSSHERYADPGAILFEPSARGRRIVRQRGPWIFRRGDGAHADGLAPFIDRQDVETARVERLFESARDALETPIALVEDEAGEIVGALTSHETPISPPNLRVRRFGVAAWTDVTHFADPQPALRGIEKRLVRYARADGVELSAMLHLPRERKAGERLPLLVWAYPHDFAEGAMASQNARSPERFTRVVGPVPILLALAGYAVLDDPKIPIVGDPETMNDRFVEQANASLSAAIDHLAGVGLIDRARVAIGGHSYGAFLTAMALATSELFRCGIARSGAFNRTLTPFGFQSERRTLWEAQRPYLELSPLFVADKIRAPLLLIHGAEDENPGTHPLQSERLFHALKGLGGTARHVVLPHEGHGYRSREAVLHVVWEMLAWLDEHLRAH